MKDTKQLWFKEAKFGLFIHFGLFSLLAGEYKGQKTENIAEWIMRDLQIPASEYEKLAQEFNPTAFDPKKIVAKAKEWGMRYIILTTKHHEGFALFDSKVSPYNSVNTPYGRDIVRELKEECDREGIRMGFYYSQAQDWDDPNGLVAHCDNSKKDFSKYFHEKCLPQVRELLTNYGDVSIMWFDTPLDMTPEQSKELFDLVKSLQPNCIVSGRIGNGIGEYMTTGDNFLPALPFDGDWEVPATLNDTWGYSKFDNAWKDPKKLIRILLKINARGGNYLLNIGPKGDGSIPEESYRILDEIGRYVNENADSIFGTFRVPQYVYDIQEVLFTAKPHKLFVHVIEPIHRYRLEILNMGNKVTRAYELSTGRDFNFDTTPVCEGDSDVNIFLPEEYREKSYYCICIEYKEEKPVFEEIVDR